MSQQNGLEYKLKTVYYIVFILPQKHVSEFSSRVFKKPDYHSCTVLSSGDNGEKHLNSRKHRKLLVSFKQNLFSTLLYVYNVMYYVLQRKQNAVFEQMTAYYYYCRMRPSKMRKNA